MIKLEAKKSFGQNFLVDRGVIDRIVAAALLSPTDSVLEVGPGMGALTRRLALEVERVVAVELDRRMVAHLKEELADASTLEVVAADILKVDLPKILTERHAGLWKVVANLPYNISSQVLFRFLEERHLFSLLLLMLQKEVGDRLVAAPATGEYGILSVLFQMHFQIRREILVRPGAFRPIPKVDSVVLSFRPLPAPREEIGDPHLFKAVVKAAFSQRRKTLHNCLKGIAGLPPHQVANALDSAGIDPRRRGETLSLAEFASLSRSLDACRNAGEEG
jgi:16S rRNA (adenine1518-N6/adenine1519-N6)-dimethyltransferase